jgi:hypothetical protein
MFAVNSVNGPYFLTSSAANQTLMLSNASQLSLASPSPSSHNSSLLNDTITVQIQPILPSFAFCFLYFDFQKVPFFVLCPIKSVRLFKGDLNSFAANAFGIRDLDAWRYLKTIVKTKNSPDAPLRLIYIRLAVRNHVEPAKTVLRLASKLNCFNINVSINAAMILCALLSSFEFEFYCTRCVCIFERAGNVQIFAFTFDVFALGF